eukprot:1541650-Rhodomonas_salina.8
MKGKRKKERKKETSNTLLPARRVTLEGRANESAARETPWGAQGTRKPCATGAQQKARDGRMGKDGEG